MIRENRKNPRFSCSVPEKFPIDFEGCQEKGYLIDICRSGIGFRTKRNFPIGSVCRLAIMAPQRDKPIEGQVRIQWAQYEKQAKDYSCGAELISMDPALKTDLIDALYLEWKIKALHYV